MPALNTILVPIDFSERSMAAAEHAGVLASRFGSKLVFLHVVPVSPYEYGAFESGLYVGSKWPKEPELQRKLNDELTKLAESFSPSSEIEQIVLKGDPPTRIERVVKEKNVDLIVMPTHGYGPFRRFVLGSVTTKVLHDVTCPILTGVHVEEIPHGGTKPYRRIACAIDLREHSKDLLKWAWEFAGVFDAELTVIHAAPALDAEPADGQYFTQKLVQMLIQAKQREVCELAEQVGCKCATLVDSADVTRYVPRAASEAEADLLVIGRSPLRGLLGRLRTHAHALIREAPCPVISV
jgi:nucleotide-binding universal stress UspA family protein